MGTAINRICSMCGNEIQNGGGFMFSYDGIVCVKCFDEKCKVIKSDGSLEEKLHINKSLLHLQNMLLNHQDDFISLQKSTLGLMERVKALESKLEGYGPLASQCPDERIEKEGLL